MKWLKVALLVFILFFLFLFVRATDFNRVLASVQQVGYRFIYLFAITFMAYFSATIGWKFCMGKEASTIGLFHLFLVRHVGETVGTVNPTGVVAAEAVKVYLLRNRGINRQTVIISVFTSRLIMIATQLLLLFISLGVLLSGNIPVKINWPGNPLLYLLLMVAIILVLLMIKTVRFGQLLHNFKWGAVVIRFSRKIKLKVVEWWIAFREFFRSSRKSAIISALFFTAHWILGSLEFYFILHFLGVKATIMQALLVDMGVMIFKSAGAFVPGQIGIEEYGNKIMLNFIGVADTEIWLTASVLRRARQLFWLLFGAAAYFWLYKRAASPTVA